MMEVPYHYQFRIIVIGDTMVGKSSLLKTFSEGTFGEMEPTVGVDFFSKIIDIQPKHRDNSAQNTRLQSNSTTAYNNSTNRLEENIIVKLQIWDTAGQERFKSIVTSYYRNSVGVVLVYDVTNRRSFEHLIDWFTEARKHVEPAPSPSLSPITQNPPSINSFDNYPLSSTPNTSSASKKSSNHHNNCNNHSNHHLGNNSAKLPLSSSNNRNSNDSSEASANLSFSSMNEMSRFGQGRNESFKIAYLVLGCKTDLGNRRQVSLEEGQAFASAYGFKFIETSSKTHYNVNQAFQLLAEELYDKISECGRLNRLHRTASGDHLTFDGAPSQVNEGIRLGPLIENSRRYGDGNRVRLLEAQPVSGYLGGCC